MLRLLRFVAGAAVATAIWWYGTPAYDSLLARAIPFAHAENRVVNVTPPNGPSARIPADQLTYNVILFGGLIAASPPRRVWRGLLALIVLLAFHVVALYLSIQSTYSTIPGFWTSVDFIYRIGGMFAIAFVCWYMTIDQRRTR